MLYGSIANILSQLLRTVFIPSPGCRYVVSDYAAIEARVLAWLAGELWVLKVFSGHGKIYEATAANMFGIPLETIVRSHENYKYRANGKVAVLACGFQGGAGAMEAMDTKQEINPDEYDGLVKRWREANPHIVKYWYKVGDAAIRAVQDKSKVDVGNGVVFDYQPGFLFVHLPSGRHLTYVNPQIGLGDFGRPQLSYEGTNDKKQWVRLRTYGGKLTENITQAVARDCLMEAIKRADSAGYPIAFHVHDEIVADTPEGFGSIDELTELMGQPIDWAPGLPLKAAGFETQFYMKD